MTRDDSIFWDRVSGVYDFFVYFINYKVRKNLRKEIAKFFDRQDVVLECGCGTGMLTEVIASNCLSLTATDFSLKMLEKASEKFSNYENIKFETANILKLDYKDNSFDKVLAANVIHLLENPHKALNELNRVCKPGGKIIIINYVNRKSDGKENLFTKIIEAIGTGFKKKFTFSSYRKFIVDAGYADAQFIDVSGFIPCSIAIIKK